MSIYAFIAGRLGLSDLAFERSAYICSALGLAAVIAPLLILFSIKTGVLASQTEKLLSNPDNLKIHIEATGLFTRKELTDLQNDPDVGFAAPHPRELGVQATIYEADKTMPRQISPNLIASGEGDPMLPPGAPAPLKGEVYLTKAALAGLGGSLNDRVIMTSRLEEGYERSLVVIGVVDSALWSGQGALLHPSDLFSLQEWTDVRGTDAGALDTFPSLRLYAADVDAAFRLVDRLNAKGTPVAAKIGDLRDLQQLRDTLQIGFFLITVVSVAGIAVSFAVSLWANVLRKRRALSLLIQGGMPRTDIAAFPVVQAFAISGTGLAMAFAFFWAAAQILNTRLGPVLNVDGDVCVLNPEHYIGAIGVTFLVALASSSLAAQAAIRIDPSEGVDRV